MRILLDTQILFWSMCMECKLPQQILSWINDRENEVFFSSASVWEIVIKHSKNPAAMPVDGYAFMDGCVKAGFLPLPLPGTEFCGRIQAFLPGMRSHGNEGILGHGVSGIC